MNPNSSRRPRHFSLQSFAALVPMLCIASSALAQVLPSLPSHPDQPAPLGSEPKLFVKEYQFEGHTVFTTAELQKVTTPFAGREVMTSDIEQARRAVTLHYVQKGYLNSGAVIPDQTPTNGVVRLQVVEGKLSSVELHGNRWLADRYITNRLLNWSGPPLNLRQMQEGLQLLRQNPNVTQVNAELKPGSHPGEGRLDLRVEDRQPFRLGLQVDNERPPSVGAEQISVLASDLNLTGHSDPLDLKYGIANNGAHGFDFSGVDNLEGRYLLPISRWDTSVGLHASRLNTSIVEDSFLPLDIKSLTTSYGITLRQPVYQTARSEAAFSVGLDHRQNKTWLLDQPFTLSRGAVGGKMNVTVLRLSQEWLRRGQNDVLALRSTFNVGLDAFGATDDLIAGNPNGSFFSWVGQGQYVRRLFNTQNELMVRVTGQWTPDPLLALEQFSVGGAGSVRGYLENQLVRDRGITSSLEFRLPVWFNQRGAGIVHLAPFFDYGAAWNLGTPGNPTTLYSVGTGVIVNPTKHLNAQLYWGYRLRHVSIPEGFGAQGSGITFRVNLEAF